MRSLPASSLRDAAWSEPLRLRVPMAVLPGAAIAGFGIGACWLIGAEVAWWPVTWFAAGTLVYSVDRWADSGPDESAMAGRGGWPTMGLEGHGWLCLSALAILLPALAGGEWALALMLAGGVLIALNYSVQLPGMPKRFRERPIVKSLMPAPAIVGAVLVLPGMRSGIAFDRLIAWAVWAWAIVQLNVWLCDWRDRSADSRSGLRSLAVILGEGGQAWTAALIVCCWMATLGVVMNGGGHALVAVMVTGYFTVLAWRIVTQGRLRFFDWWVDGGLLLPAALFGLWQLA